MNCKIIITFTISMIMFISVAGAITIEYDIIVKENGDALVISTLDGSGLISMKLQEDVEEIKIKGALYNFEKNTVEISIGSTEKAIIAYKTSMLTSKSGEEWILAIDLVESNHTQVTMYLPRDVNVGSTTPKAFIEDGEDFRKIVWAGEIKEINLSYSFSEFEDELPGIDEEFRIVIKDDPNKNLLILVSVALLIAVAIGLAFLMRNKKRLKNKTNIIKTLPKNEALIVKVISEHKGGVKRNQLERITKVAKSSLASSLHNLEKKNIIDLDRTYTVHYVRFTKWFEEL